MKQNTYGKDLYLKTKAGQKQFLNFQYFPKTLRMYVTVTCNVSNRHRPNGYLSSKSDNSNSIQFISYKTDLFKEYCLDTAKLFIQTYPWYNMPTTVHKVLFQSAN